jgi:hypothetical protein
MEIRLQYVYFSHVKLESVGDVVGFAIIHEGLHLSTINDLLKVINHQNK